MKEQGHQWEPRTGQPLEVEALKEAEAHQGEVLAEVLVEDLAKATAEGLKDLKTSWRSSSRSSPSPRSSQY